MQPHGRLLADEVRRISSRTADREVETAKIGKQLQPGNNQPTWSEWVASFRLVTKNGEKLRFCVDYWKPNPENHVDSYLMTLKSYCIAPLCQHASSAQ